jgi:hypothetical protein
VIVLVCAAASTACGPTDPCAGAGGTCVSLTVTSSLVGSIDSLQLTVSGAVSGSKTSEIGRRHSLPVTMAIRVASPTASGTLHLIAIGNLDHQPVGSGATDVELVAGQTIPAGIEIEPRSVQIDPADLSMAPDLAATGADGGTAADLTVPATPTDLATPADLRMPPDLMVVNSLPFVVDSLFLTTGVMGDAEQPGSVTMIPQRPGDSTDCMGQRSSATAKGNCHMVTYVPSGRSGWAGTYWQYPANNWGASPGYPIPPGATQVSFMAKGAKGGEKVTFWAGGLGGSGQPYADTVKVSQTFTLTSSWTRYSLDLTTQTYSAVIGGFAWSMDASGGSSASFSIDDIQWK